MDERLRAAERAYEASGSNADRLRLYAERARQGEVVPSLVAGCWLERVLVTGGGLTIWRGLHVESGTVQAVRLYRVDGYPGPSPSRRRLQRIARIYDRRSRVVHPTVPEVFSRGEEAVPLQVEVDDELDLDPGAAPGAPPGPRFFQAPRSKRETRPVPHYVVREALIESAEELECLSRAEGGLPWRDVLGFAIPLCGALAAARDAGLVHRAITPRRILVSAAGEPFLLGWAHAQPLPGSPERELMLTRASSAIGAPYFMSPEQLRGQEPTTTASDVYSLAASLYTALVGRFPFTGETMPEVMGGILERPVPDPRDHVADLPESVVTLVRQGMHKDPTRRPGPELLAEACAALLADEPLPRAITALARRGWLSTVWNALGG